MFFSRNLFAYPVVDASAISTAKVLIDIMTRHTYLPTTLITDKGTAFTSRLVDEIAKILGIQIKCATTKHPQAIGELERTDANLKSNLKKASEYQRQYQKYLPLAVLKYNISYRSSQECEPSRTFHGTVPYIILDHRLELNPKPKISPTTDFAEKFQKPAQILIDKTKKNIMQRYLKYKEYYDQKAKTAPLEKGDFCFFLQCHFQLLADHQGSKIPSREFRWIRTYVIEKVLPNENYIVRKLNSNKTQIYIAYDYEKTSQILAYKIFPRKETCKQMMKLLFHKTFYTLFRGKQILKIFPESRFKQRSDDYSADSNQ